MKLCNYVNCNVTEWYSSVNQTHFQIFRFTFNWLNWWVSSCEGLSNKNKKIKRVFPPEVWHQHDGILHPKYATTFRQNLFDSHESKILQDIQAYILNWCPVFCYGVTGLSAPEILEKIDMMNKSLENIYCHRFNEFTAPDALKISLLAVSKPFYTFHLVNILVSSFF